MPAVGMHSIAGFEGYRARANAGLSHGLILQLMLLKCNGELHFVLSYLLS